MSDTITARGTESKFKAHPEGQYVGQCVDAIDLGEHVHSFAGDESYIEQRCALVFRTGEKNEQTGDYIDVSKEFTVSMGERANLRKFLEQWRGKPYTPEQIKAGVPLHKLTDNHGLLTIVQQQNKANTRTYAVIAACVGIPKMMASSTAQYDDYTREAFWATRKAEYAAEVAKFRATAVAIPASEEAPPVDDDLPF